ncbi:S8 family serine peptidase [Cohnella sp. GbtcB17]|uniref:S8 family serine peptidase n=1 Tax=Cohnella sp. GbtcB17 TaxID=2824762 RepID=UPI001C30D162|nr:S8 family serine peptidase [Cohnella sp. GbtcB17]
MNKAIIFIIFIVSLFCCLVSCKNHEDNYITAQNLDVRKYIGLNNEAYKNFSGKGITIAVMDSGLSPHKDLNINNVVFFKDFVNTKETIYDDNGHGTFITGILANNGLRKGLAYNCKLIVIKVLDEEGNSNWSIIEKAFNWLSQNQKKYNIQIVNMSFGMNVTVDKNNEIYKKIHSMKKNGVVFVSSTGNGGLFNEKIMFPGNLEEVLTVGYINNNQTLAPEDDQVAISSSRGGDGQITKPNFVTLGVDIESLNREDGYTIDSGSSYSAAIMSGTIAVLKEKYPNYNFDSLIELLKKNTILLANETFNSQGNGSIYFPS